MEKEVPSKCISYVQPGRHITTAFRTNGIDCLVCSWTCNKRAKGSKDIDLGLAFLQQRPPKFLDRHAAILLLLYQDKSMYLDPISLLTKLSCHMLPPLPNAEAVSMSFHSGHRPLKSECSRGFGSNLLGINSKYINILQFNRIYYLDLNPFLMFFASKLKAKAETISL